MSNRILTLSAAITGIALNGVDNAVFAFLHDTDMIGLTILRTGRALIIPIEENDLTGRRFKAAVLPLATILEPLHAVDTGRKFRNNTAVDIAAFIGTPGNKAGAPLHARIESIPGPIRLTAYIANLRQCHRYDLAITHRNTVQHR